MLRLDSKSTSFSGASIIDGVEIAYINASRTGDIVNLGATINDASAYLVNKATVEADICELLAAAAATLEEPAAEAEEEEVVSEE